MKDEILTRENSMTSGHLQSMKESRLRTTLKPAPENRFILRHMGGIRGKATGLGCGENSVYFAKERCVWHLTIPRHGGSSWLAAA